MVDLVGELTELARLHNDGALTDEEYAAFKAQLLGAATSVANHQTYPTSDGSSSVGGALVSQEGDIGSHGHPATSRKRVIRAVIGALSFSVAVVLASWALWAEFGTEGRMARVDIPPEATGWHLPHGPNHHIPRPSDRIFVEGDATHDYWRQLVERCESDDWSSPDACNELRELPRDGARWLVAYGYSCGGRTQVHALTDCAHLR